jgi:Cytochrome c/MORN repeat variant
MKTGIIYIISLLIIIIGILSFSQKENEGETFYKNGKLKSEYFFDNNCKCNRSIEYFENGAIRAKKQYSNLGIDGTDTFFFINGMPSIACEWKNGIQVGTQFAFYKDGKTAFEQYYQDGYKKGEWKYYDSLGMLYKTIKYEENIVLWNSDLETNITKHFKAGKLYLIETFKDNKKVKTEIIDKIIFENQELKLGEQLFNSSCSICHFEEEYLFGPSLNNLKNNHNEAWLIAKITNDEKLNNDPENKALKEKWNSDKHPNFENLTENEIKRIINYLK